MAWLILLLIGFYGGLSVDGNVKWLKIMTIGCGILVLTIWAKGQ